ncbi:MAG: protein-L-isoaspartate(D-aspartate) O-methyltransferase [Saprospiraceae bacterium]
MKDTYRHQGLRKKLVQDLAAKGIKDPKVLAAIGRIPRHFFLEKTFEDWAYQDKAFPIGNQQTISQPFTVAYQTSLLAVKKREKILEIGTGSGYQAAVLGILGARVYTIERQEDLHHRATKLLQALEIGNIRTFFKDGYKGLPEFAPFAKILVTAGANKIPVKLKQQLAIGGIMVIPVGQKVQRMYKITRLSDTDFQEEVLDTFRFVPFLEGVEKSK